MILDGLALDKSQERRATPDPIEGALSGHWSVSGWKRSARRRTYDYGRRSHIAARHGPRAFSYRHQDRQSGRDPEFLDRHHWTEGIPPAGLRLSGSLARFHPTGGARHP